MRKRLLVRMAAGAVAAAVFGMLSMSGAAAPGGGGGGKSKRDNVPPTITGSISQQTAGSVVVSGAASDNVGVTEVDVAFDGGTYAVAQGTASWSYTIDTSKLAAGSHTATAKARDAAGNTATASTSFSVTAAVTSTPPTATILAPSANTTVAGTITVNGTASGSNQVAKVELSVDGGAYSLVQGTTSWSGSVNTSVYPNGAHTLHARATDTAGNVGVSSEAISVSNDVVAPTVAVATPSAGATVSGTLSMAGSASDDMSVAKVEVSVDSGAYAAAQGTTSWAYSLDTTQLANGSHTLTARATDGTGKASTSSVTVTVSNSTSTSGQHLITPEGVTIDVAPDVTNWTAQQIYDLLKPNAYQLSLIGPHLTIEVQSQCASSTTATVSGSPGRYYGYKAITYLCANGSSAFSNQPDAICAHEYGHAWSLYHLYITHQGEWSSYLQARGIAGDSRLDSSYMWDRKEIIAEDYRLLFGTSAAQTEMTQMNYQIPDARDVAGLKSFLSGTWG